MRSRASALDDARPSARLQAVVVFPVSGAGLVSFDPMDDFPDGDFTPNPGNTDPLEGAVGVMPMTLVHEAVCGVTGKSLPAGSEAYMVLFDDPGRKLITGRDALPQASTPNQENADD